MIVDLDSKEESYKNIVNDLEEKKSTIKDQETKTKTAEQLQSEYEKLVNDLQFEIKNKDIKIKELSDNLDKKRSKIDDIKSQFKNDHKKIKESLISHYDDEIKKLKEEIENNKKINSDQTNTIQELTSIKRQNTDANTEIEK